MLPYMQVEQEHNPVNYSATISTDHRYLLKQARDSLQGYSNVQPLSVKCLSPKQ